jgi:hypothetical protein
MGDTGKRKARDVPVSHDSKSKGRLGARDVSTPKSKTTSSKEPPATPMKKPRMEGHSKSELSSAARSLTPLFNGFRAARDRASQLGGRYVTISKRSRVGNTSSNRKKVGLLSSGASSSTGRPGRRVERKAELSVQTGDMVPVKESRVLRFDNLIAEDKIAALAAQHEKRKQEKPMR